MRIKNILKQKIQLKGEKNPVFESIDIPKPKYP